MPPHSRIPVRGPAAPHEVRGHGCPPSAQSRARRAIVALTVLLCGVAAAGCSTSTAGSSTSADASVAPFAGSWSGQMTFSDATAPQSVEVTIPDSCTPGEVCGETDNPDVSCTWEMTLDEADGTTLSYTFSAVKSAQDEALCQTGVGTSGILTLQSDGTLRRVHELPDFTASGTLTKQM
jgi:hypothetical protein